MSNTTLNQLVREQILAEGPSWEEGPNGHALYAGLTKESYIDDQLLVMTNVELLDRIVDDTRCNMLNFGSKLVVVKTPISVFV
jgi:hypothetical protein